jgi:hypothetical protein
VRSDVTISDRRSFFKREGKRHAIPRPREKAAQGEPILFRTITDAPAKPRFLGKRKNRIPIVVGKNYGYRVF